MENTFVSTAEYYGEAIDCRALTFEFEFYDLSCSQISMLVEYTMLRIWNILSDAFVVKWSVAGRTVNKKMVLPIMKNHICDGCGVILGFEAMVIGSVVYNSSTMKAYFNKMKYIPDLSPGVSMDYQSYWNTLFPNGREDSEKTLDGIIQIFEQKQRHIITRYHLPDVQGFLSAQPYISRSDAYFGSFQISMNALCISKCIHTISNLLSGFAIDIANRFININARIQFQPIEGSRKNPHMQYFGTMARLDGSHIQANCTKKEWYESYYIPGSEWFNILSPLAQRHLLQRNKKDTNVDVLNLEGGGLLVRSAKAIDLYDVDDALVIKKYLYPALFPGRSSISLRHLFSDDPYRFRFAIMPRCGWETIALLEGEVKIVGTDLAFSHLGIQPKS